MEKIGVFMFNKEGGNSRLREVCREIDFNLMFDILVYLLNCYCVLGVGDNSELIDKVFIFREVIVRGGVRRGLGNYSINLGYYGVRV